MYEQIPDILSVAQAALILHVGKGAIYHAISNNELRAKMVGKKYIIPKNCLLDFLKIGDITCQQRQA